MTPKYGRALGSRGRNTVVATAHGHQAAPAAEITMALFRKLPAPAAEKAASPAQIILKVLAGHPEGRWPISGAPSGFWFLV